MELNIGEYKDLMSRAVSPRPVILITTISPAGVVNMAPFSAVTFCSYDPPMILVSVGGRKHDPKFVPEELKGKLDIEEEKDTYANLKSSGEFVAHLVSEELLDAVVIADKRYPKEVSEVEKAKLTLIPSKLVKPPRIKEAKLSFECQVTDTFNIRADHLLVVGKGVAFHADESALSEGRLDTSRMKPVVHYFGDIFGICDRLIVRKDRDRYKLD
jgi:flavin reductase (DIM6/NTAB) family NADH-FMN oxidoreductase RutF